MLKLINCTRTGGWVDADGVCTSQTHHTLPAQAPVYLDPGISDLVARPYAKYLAEKGILDHYAINDPSWRMCNWGGYCDFAWGENIASPVSPYLNGMVAVQIFYQNESPCACWHYYNIMSPLYHRVGIGVWVDGSHVRVVMDFYE